MAEDKLNKLLQRFKSSDDDSDGSSGDSDNNTNSSSSSGSSGGGRGARFSADDGGMDDQQTDLTIGSAEYMEYVQAVEADKVCSTVSDVATKAVVFNKFRDIRDVDASYKADNITNKSVQKTMTAARKSACMLKRLERVNYEANQSVETAHRNFLRYRSKASVCSFDSHYDKETRDYGISRDQFLRRHDYDGNGRVNRHDDYLMQHDANGDRRVDERDGPNFS